MANVNATTVSLEQSDAPSPIGHRCELHVHDQVCTGNVIDLRDGVLTFELDDGLIRWIGFGVGVSLHRID